MDFDIRPLITGKKYIKIPQELYFVFEHKRAILFASAVAEESGTAETEMKQKKTTTVIWICATVLFIAVSVICVHYIGLRPVVTVELGDPLPAAGDVARPGDRYAQEVGTLPAGNHIIRVIHNGVPTPVLVRVRDTVAPTGDPRERTIAYGETLTPDKLVTKIRDESVVRVSFSEPFDFDRVGDFDVSILLTDASGNKSTIRSALHICAVTESITAEAGSPAPGADAFLLDGVTAEAKMLPTEDMMRHVGTYLVEFLLKNGQTVTSALIVTDTVPPTGDSTSLWICPGDPIVPEALVSNPHDETDLTFSLLNEPDESTPHVQKVTVRMTDEGGNTTDVESDLVISRIEPIALEASSEPITPETLSADETVALAETFVPDTVGIYTVPVTVDGAEDFVLVTVVDTTAPTVEPRPDAALYTLHPVSPDAAFSAQDYSPVQMTWITEPDWDEPGEQTVFVRAEDASGNAVEMQGTVVLSEDTEPPELYGVVDRTAYVGEPIAYLAEVYAEDAVDGRTKVTVDSKVETEKAGTYEVTFTTVDVTGNTASATCKYKLVAATVSEEDVRALAQDVLKEITTDDMVTAEKLRAVFDYTRGHVHYVGDSDKKDWRKEAVRGFKTGRGDCFTFYSVSRALLDELGIEYMSVTRLGGRTRHYWTIVNIGTGWYHFDTTLAPRHKHKCFMWTNEQCKVKPYFWRYEQAKYPDIATERFDYDEVVRLEREGLLP